MTDAVVVSNARTGLAKMLARRAQHDPRRDHGRATPSGTRSSAPGLDAGRSRGRDDGMRVSRRRHRRQHRAPDRAARRLPGDDPGATVNRFCSSGLQTIALAAQRIIAAKAEIFVAGGVESISCVQNEMNTHMLREPWLVEHKPDPLLADAADRRERRASATASRARRRTSTACAASSARRPPRRPARFNDEIVPADGDDGGGRQGIQAHVHARSHACIGRGHSRRHDLRRGGEDQARRCPAASSPPATPASSPTARRHAWS